MTKGKLKVTNLGVSLTDRSYLSLDWEPEIKKKYFDETVVEVRRYQKLLNKTQDQ